MAKLLNNFFVGCDPEFVVVSKEGRLITVEALGQGAVGQDHGGKCVELRPEQARGTFTLVKRLHALFQQQKLQAFASHRWRAGAYFNNKIDSYMPLGGHVHISLKADELHPKTVSALDAFTAVLERTNILPRQECIMRRSTTAYGRWSEIRNDTADGHTEYRTMASWLYNPWVAFLALTGAKLAATAPLETLDALKTATSRKALVRYFELFKTKDSNAQRLLLKLEHPKWLDNDPDVDIKKSWLEPL